MMHVIDDGADGRQDSAPGSLNVASKESGTKEAFGSEGQEGADQS